MPVVGRGQGRDEKRLITFANTQLDLISSCTLHFESLIMWGCSNDGRCSNRSSAFS
jgi:hypothetical protein